MIIRVATLRVLLVHSWCHILSRTKKKDFFKLWPASQAQLGKKSLNSKEITHIFFLENIQISPLHTSILLSTVHTTTNLTKTQHQNPKETLAITIHGFNKTRQSEIQVDGSATDGNNTVLKQF